MLKQQKQKLKNSKKEKKGVNNKGYQIPCYYKYGY